MVRKLMHLLGVTTLVCVGAVQSMSAWADGLSCNRGELKSDLLSAKIVFETASACKSFVAAQKKVNQGKAKPKHEKTMETFARMTRNLSDGDTLLIDRFGRGHLTRCSPDPTSTEPKMSFNKPIGPEGDTLDIYMAMELPANAAQCTSQE